MTGVAPGTASSTPTTPLAVIAMTTAMPVSMPIMYGSPRRAPNAAPVAERLSVPGPGLPASANAAMMKPTRMSN